MIWREGALHDFPDPGDEPFAWLTRLDDPAVTALMTQVPLHEADLRDLAGRPKAGMRAMRRRLTRLLIARLAGVHPDAVVIDRTPAGALRVVAPAGWFVSVAGRWPLCLVGVSRAPVGVDVEPFDADPPPDDALTPDELAEAAPAERVVRWVAKEAHAKLFGVAAQIEAAAIATAATLDGATATSAYGRSVCSITRAESFVAVVATPFHLTS